MSLFILQSGRELGPFEEGEARRMLREGRVHGTDRAREAGMTTWASLEQILPPEIAAIRLGRGEQGRRTEVPPTQPVRVELLATPQQKAFLSYMGVSFAPEISEGQAAELMLHAQRHPKDPTRLARWTDERARLFPDIFADDVQARKEKRADHFLIKVQTEGRECFKGVAKAHCQVLLSYLDVKFPNWDARDDEAAWQYFFPALAEKFPKLVTKAWRGKLHYRQGPRVAPEVGTRRLEISTSSRRTVASVMALVVVVSAGLAGGGWWWFRQHNEPAPTEMVAATAAAPISVPVTEASAATTSKEMAAEPAPTEGKKRKRTAKVQPAPAATVEKPAAVPAPAVAPAAVQTPAPSLARAAAPATARTSVVLVQPIEVQLAYGTVVLRPGTNLRVVSQTGDWVNVQYMNSIVPVPVRSTDLAYLTR